MKTKLLSDDLFVALLSQLPCLSRSAASRKLGNFVADKQ